MYSTILNNEVTMLVFLIATNIFDLAREID